jgi:cell division protein ZapD
MIENYTVYELPLNELIRVCLRLEYLEQSALENLPGTTALAHRAVLAALLDMLALLDRPDLRGKLIQEVRRLRDQLQKYADTPHVDQKLLTSTLLELQQGLELLQSQTGKFAKPLRENDFLNGLIQYQSIPGGHCGYNTPSLIWWSQLAAIKRRSQLQHWLNAMADVLAIKDLLLRLVRDSGVSQRQNAQKGFFQMTLNTQVPVQLVRVHIPPHSDVFPQASASKHGINIRFAQTDTIHPTRHTSEDVEFYLSCCR